MMHRKITTMAALTNRAASRYWRQSICSASAAELVVKVKSQSLIKPSSPTPTDLRHFKLSLLDTIHPSPLYSTFVLFYPPPNHPTVATNAPQKLLQDSLPQTLSRFYPLAGRIRPDDDHKTKEYMFSRIDCNDDGAEYLEAEANQEMLHFLRTTAPNTRLLSRFAPARPASSLHSPLACVQTTVFPCGGVALGVSVNHLFGDAHTLSMFVRQWAADAARAGGHDRDSPPPHPGKVQVSDKAASLFPISNDVMRSKPMVWRESGSVTEWSEEVKSYMAANPITSQRFVFLAEAILALKAKVASSEVPNPSRSLAILALIWKTAMKAHRTASPPGASSPSSVAYTVVDIRPKLKTEELDSSVGNLVWSAVARDAETTASQDHGEELTRQLARQLKQSVEEVDGEFVGSLKGEGGHEKFQKWLEERGTVKGYQCSSIVNVGINETDFGWGKPAWVSYLGFTDFPVPDFVVLSRATAASGGDDAVEAYVSLADKEMAIFEKDDEFLQYATVNPKLTL